jgi:UDP-N-acetylglucosamine 2-epimerase (non-hydrolysing)
MSSRIKVVNVVGARPNLVKMAPLLWAMGRVPEIQPILVHTGQHYNDNLSDIFFRQLDIPLPDYHLDVGSGTHSYQTAQVMLKLEKLVQELSPDLVLVVGDVNSTLAGALVASKLAIPVAHVEAGLRSFDRTMPEEINRIVTDSVSNFLFISEPSGVENLRREGIEDFLENGGPVFEVLPRSRHKRIGTGRAPALQRLGAFVGNVMIDTLLAIKQKADKEAKIDIPGEDYAVLTLHRPSNVDDRLTFERITKALHEVSLDIPIIFPCHPRTLNRIQEFGLGGYLQNRFGAFPKPLSRSIALVDPLGYLEFLKLMSNAKVMITDSGGIQEETTILGIPCITLRENTERPTTISEGTNILAGTDPVLIVRNIRSALNCKENNKPRPKLWDGQAAERIVRIILELLL